MLRLFIGIALPPERRLALSVLSSGLPGARWVDPGNFHVTLRFVGEVGEGMAEDIDWALRGVRSPGFELSIAGVDLFGSMDRSRVLYARVEPAPLLLQLRDRVGAALGRAGLRPDPRRYMPHVTLANLKSPERAALQTYVEANNLFRLAPFAVNRFQLVRSWLTRAGSIYEAIAEYDLT